MSNVKLDDDQKMLLIVVNKIISDAEIALTHILGRRIDISVKIHEVDMNYEELIQVNLQRLVCNEYNVTWAEIVRPTRGVEEIAAARRAYCYLAKRVLGHSLKRIMRDINRKNHTTIINNVQRAEKFISIGDDASIHILNIKTKLYENID